VERLQNTGEDSKPTENYDMRKNTESFGGSEEGARIRECVERKVAVTERGGGLGGVGGGGGGGGGGG